jgi:hypothetical protein
MSEERDREEELAEQAKQAAYEDAKAEHDWQMDRAEIAALRARCEALEGALEKIASSGYNGPIIARAALAGKDKGAPAFNPSPAGEEPSVRQPPGTGLPTPADATERDEVLGMIAARLEAVGCEHGHSVAYTPPYSYDDMISCAVLSYYRRGFREGQKAGPEAAIPNEVRFYASERAGKRGEGEAK